MSGPRLALRIAKAGALYFACVFGAGFVFGSIRVPLLVPRLGVRWAELTEMPLMACVIVFAAGWVLRRSALPPTRNARLGMGAVALALMLMAEFALAWVLSGRAPAAVVASRDPVSGSVYAALLLAFAAMPLFVARRTGA